MKNQLERGPLEGLHENTASLSEKSRAYRLLSQLFGPSFDRRFTSTSLPSSSFLPFNDVIAWLRHLRLWETQPFVTPERAHQKCLDHVLRPPGVLRSPIAADDLDRFLSVLECDDRLYSSARLVSVSELCLRLLTEIVFVREKKAYSATLQIARHLDQASQMSRVPLSSELALDITPIFLQTGLDCLSAALPSGAKSDALSLDDVRVFFSNRQLIVDRLERKSATHVEDCVTAAGINSDRAHAERVYREVLRSPKKPQTSINRHTHPRVGPILHVLPRLLTGPKPHTPLSFLTALLPQIRARGFRCLLLGCVDPQTVSAYYGQGEHGEFLCHANTHGYWSSGASGIDPFIGCESDYRDLVMTAKKEGILFVQDYVVATLGYPAQLHQLGLDGISKPLSHLVVGEKEVDVTDPAYFLHYPFDIPEDPPRTLRDAERYAEAVTRAHLGSPFALPKLNLYRPAVCEMALRRAHWQIATAGASSFRIDMAKHIGLPQLSSILGNLREKTALAGICGTSRSFVLLEYWSINYRDLRFASDALGTQIRDTYFFDFPLASALQNILFRRHSFVDTIDEVLKERTRWGIHPNQLIPLLVDHDFNFRPIYNGTDQSRALVICGYALAIMLSTNCPYVYFGVFDRRNGVPEIERYLDYSTVRHSELLSRIPTECLFRVDDAASPLKWLMELIKLSYEEIAVDQVDAEPIHVYGDADFVTISRLGFRRGRPCRIEATVSRSAQKELRDESAAVLFSHNVGPSVVIRSYGV